MGTTYCAKVYIYIRPAATIIYNSKYYKLIVRSSTYYCKLLLCLDVYIYFYIVTQRDGLHKTYCALLQVLSQHLPRRTEERQKISTRNPGQDFNNFITQSRSITAIFVFFFSVKAITSVI